MTGVLVIAVFFAGAVGVARWAPNRATTLMWSVVPFVVAVVFIAYARRSSLFLEAPINPDEAQFLADAIQVASGRWLPWIDFDTGTVGFVVPYSLVPAVTLFPEHPYFAARILAIVCAAIWSFGGMLAFRTVTSRGASLVLAAPLVVIAGLPGNQDLLTYSSELLPLALAFGGFGVALFATLKRRSLWVTAIGFAMLGLVPFAKLQVAPIAFVFAVIVLTQGLAIPVLWRNGRRTVVSLTVGLAPLSAVIFGMLISASLRDRVRDTIAFTQSYTGEGDSWQTTLSFFFLGDAFRDLARLSCGIALAATVATVFVPRIRQHSGRRCLSLVAITAPLGLVCMVTPGRSFPHYVWVGAVPALFGVLAFVAVGLSLVISNRRRRVVIVAAVSALVIALGIPGSVRSELHIPPIQLTQDVWGATPSGTRLGTPDQLEVKRVLQSCPGPVGVWGWDPHILVVTHRPYVGRSSAISPTDVASQRAWAQTVVGARPGCIIDATGPHQFAFTCGEECALQNQSFAHAVLTDYRRVLDLPDYRVYKRLSIP